MTEFDGLYRSSADYPADQPVLPPAPRKGQFRWTPPADALSREQYLAIGRPMLLAAGFLKDDTADEKPALPPMPDTGRKRKAKPAAPPKPKEPGCPF